MRISGNLPVRPAGAARPPTPASNRARATIAPETTAPAKTPVKVMSFNIRGLRGIPGKGFDRAEAEKIVAIIVRENPDVVLFQEVDRGTKRGGGHDQIDYIRDRVDEETRKLRGEAKPGDVVFGASLNRLEAPDGDRDGQYGNAILTRNGFTIDGGETAEAFQLPGGEVERNGKKHTSEPRTALVATVRSPKGRTFTAVSTHLATESSAIRAKQLEALTGITKEHGADVPLVLGGDFNEGAMAAGTQRFTRESGLTDAFTAAGLPPGDWRRATTVTKNGLHEAARKVTGFLARFVPNSWQQKFRPFSSDIDRIFTAGAEVKSTRVVSAERATDHNAVVTDLVI